MIHQNPQTIDASSETHEDLSSPARPPIDYDEILADFEPGAPGGVIVFSTRGYATAEEADAALEAFLMKAFGASDEDA